MQTFALFLSTLGCTAGTAEVIFEGDVQAFGLVGSALHLAGDSVEHLCWPAESPLDALCSGEGHFGSSVVIATELDGCERAQEEMTAWGNASEALFEASDDGADAEAFCEGAPDFLREMAEVSNRLYSAPRNALQLGYYQDSELGNIDERSYKIGSDEGDVSVSASYRSRPAQQLDPDEEAAAWDVEACARASSNDDESDGDYWIATSGSVTFDSFAEGGANGSAKSTLEGQGETEGSFEMSVDFDAVECDLDWPDVLVIL